MNKRDFIKSAAAVAAVTRLGLPVHATRHVESASSPQPVSAVVYDARFSDACRFADELGRQGAVAFATQQDVARLWYASLRDHLAQRPGRIAGLATHADLVVLQSFAAGNKLRVLYEGMHDCRGSKTLTHVVRRCSADFDVLHTLQNATNGWPVALASTLARSPRSSGSQSAYTAATHTLRAADHPGALVSWLIG